MSMTPLVAAGPTTEQRWTANEFPRLSVELYSAVLAIARLVAVALPVMPTSGARITTKARRMTPFRFPCELVSAEGASARNELGGGAAALLDRILHVVRLRSKKQMIRTDAGTVIARVAHVHPFRDGAEVEFPRCTMRKGSVENPVADTLAGSGPHPAFARRVYFRPEALGQGGGRILVGHLDSLGRGVTAPGCSNSRGATCMVILP